MPATSETLTALLAAAALGALVGLERQSHAKEEPFAGVRTFAFYALWGAFAAMLGEEYGGGAFVAALLALAGILVASFVISSTRTGDWGSTTELAALVVFGVGALAWSEEFVAATAVAVGTAALLESKEVLRQWADRFLTGRH